MTKPKVVAINVCIDLAAKQDSGGWPGWADDELRALLAKIEEHEYYKTMAQQGFDSASAMIRKKQECIDELQKSIEELEKENARLYAELAKYNPKPKTWLDMLDPR